MTPTPKTLLWEGYAFIAAFWPYLFVGRCHIPRGLLTILTYLIFTIFLGFTGTGSWDSVTPINWYRNILNAAPWVDFLMKSLIMSYVGHHSMESSYLSIRSVTKEYLMFMCFVRLLIEAFTLFSKRIALLLYWYTILSKTSYPWMYNQYLVHST